MNSQIYNPDFAKSGGKQTCIYTVHSLGSSKDSKIEYTKVESSPDATVEASSTY
jgi:hypothetical protein